MFSEISNLEVMGVTAVVPSNHINNMDYGNLFGEQAVKKQIKVTGISDRYCLEEGQSVIDLSKKAVTDLLEHTRWNGTDISFLIYVSAYEYQASPSTANYLLQYISAGDKSVGFDMNLGCSAFIVGLYTLGSMMQKCKQGTKGILVVSDSTSVGGTNDDKTVSMLSGDCATATAIEVRGNDTWKFQQRFDGSRYKYLYRKDLVHNLHMDGMAVFEFTITDVADSIKDYFNKCSLEIDCCDYYILHQAQKYIVTKVAQFSGLPKEKLLTSYNYFGNTGGPSLPCTLCANIEKMNDKDKINVFFSGFGSGLSWGMVILPIRCDRVYPVAFMGKEEV